MYNIDWNEFNKESYDSAIKILRKIEETKDTECMKKYDFLCIGYINIDNLYIALSYSMPFKLNESDDSNFAFEVRWFRNNGSSEDLEYLLFNYRTYWDADINKDYETFKQEFTEYINKTINSDTRLQRWYSDINEQDVQKIFSEEVLRNIDSYDLAIGTIVRKILFDENTKVDWNKAYDYMMKYMPELKGKYEVR